MRKLIVFVALLLIGSCIDRLDITVPYIYTRNVIVVDGVITDAPGPYQIRLTNPIKIDAPTSYVSFTEQAVSVKKITLFDDLGNSEVLNEVDKGIYQTSASGIQGAVGRTYYIRIETFDGKIYESAPDKMEPVGKVDSIYYEFETIQPPDAPTEYGYRVYMDAEDVPGGNNFVRWKFTGTYVVETLPQFKLSGPIPMNSPTRCPPSKPYPCSGYTLVGDELRHGIWTVNPATGDPEYQGSMECTCCRCWVTQAEDQPHLSNKQIIEDGKFHKVEVGFVPINFYTFQEKYRVEVQQMSLSRAAFDYWRAFQAQKVANNSLFQPITGKIPSNLTEVTAGSEVLGIFYASSVKKKQIYMNGNSIRYLIRTPVDCLGREGPIGETCRTAFFPFATTDKPADWEN